MAQEPMAFKRFIIAFFLLLIPAIVGGQCGFYIAGIAGIRSSIAHLLIIYASVYVATLPSRLYLKRRSEALPTLKEPLLRVGDRSNHRILIDVAMTLPVLVMLFCMALLCGLAGTLSHGFLGFVSLTAAIDTLPLGLSFAWWFIFRDPQNQPPRWSVDLANWMPRVIVTALVVFLIVGVLDRILKKLS